MKLARWVAGVVMMGMMAGSVHAGEGAYLVKVVGMDRQVEVKTLSEADFKALEKTIKLEQKYFSKAVEMAAKDWRGDEMNKGKPYAGSRLSAPMIAAAQKYPSLEKAEAQLARIQDQEAKKLEKKGGKKASSKKGQDDREIDLAQAADVVKIKLDELIGKAGGNAPEAKPEAAKEAVKKVL